MITDTLVTGVDADAQLVTTGAGDSFGYGELIWATGGDPRRLACEGRDLSGLHAIRTRADVEALKDELGAAQTIAIVGGGYIGLEAAAVLTKLGKTVTILEAMDRVLARVAGPVLSHFYEAEHRAHGVTIRTGVMVSAISGANGRATGVVLEGGETVPADLIIVGIALCPLSPRCWRRVQRVRMASMSMTIAARRWRMSLPSAIAPPTPTPLPVVHISGWNRFRMPMTWRQPSRGC